MRLVDLGAARPLGRLLRRGEQVGTDRFDAPELAAARGGPVTTAMDVFGIGATLQAALDPDDGDRPWPRWADGGLHRDARRRRPATVPA